MRAALYLSYIWGYTIFSMQEVLQTVPKPQERPCTYADYAAWPEGERWELIEMVPYDMSPAPKRRHQDVLPVEVLESSIEMDRVLI